VNPAQIEAQLTPLVRSRFGAEARVDEIRPLAGDASTRSYARAWLSGGAAPATAVVMLLADRGLAISSEELAVLPETEELPFINVYHFLRALGTSVPEVFVDASPSGIVLLEDIGDLALRDAAEAAGAEERERLYRLAIDELLRLQIEGTRRRDEGCIAFQQSFDERLYLWEFEHFLEWGIEKRLGPLPAAPAEVLRTHFARIAARLGALPQVLNHRDYHSWNLYVQDGQIRVIDFQDALLAAAPYDLATLLGDRDTPSIVSAALEARLLDYYRRRWEEIGGAPWDAEEFVEIYRLCALQKALKVVGRFHYLHLVKNKAGYLRYLPPTVAQVRRLLALLPGWAPIGEVLEPLYPRLQ
jgi:N-acetylmuramate 1-kinase